MVFVKIVKNKAYFKRFQVKYRRRREGKTDYRARKRLVTQDKNKYNSPKYRLVVRHTNQDITAQIIKSKIDGDYVVTAAYAHELKRYGITLGLTNYASTYAVGLLIARRLLQKLGLDKKFEGVKNPNGEIFHISQTGDGPRPFTALLDVGLKRTTTGCRVFAALKGAVDGGLNVPHNEKRFVGYNKEEKAFKADVLRKHIFGTHIGEYMKKLRESNPAQFESQFARFVKAGIDEKKIEEVYKKAHAAIRADPSVKITQKKKPAQPKKYNKKRLTLAERKARVATKLAQVKARPAATTTAGGDD
jgi:large subunit ribosomal protein L5e